MIDVKKFNTSMKATWISKLYNGQNETWTANPRKCELKFLLNMNTEMEKQIPNNLPQFYKEVIMS